MRPEEQVDLDKMKAEIQGIKLRAYDFMHEAIRFDDNDLKHSGHKSVGDALIYAVKRAEKDILKVPKDFLRKWPDE